MKNSERVPALAVTLEIGLTLPKDYDKEDQRIKAAAKKIQSDSKVLVVIGIGGSYLGAKW